MTNNSKKKPLVSVLMPVYNSELFLNESIESILNQTYNYFEFIIMNDGSTDNSENIIKSYNDERIIYFKSEKNLGIIETLNNGIELAKGKYIIRMDSDDFSYPQRFEKQIEFMELQNEVDISGTWFLKTDRLKPNTYPISFEECEINLLYNTVLCHPSIILRKESIVKSNLKFKSSALHAEDYKFWIDAVIAGLKISNLPIVLLKYRMHPMQISTLKNKIQNQTVTNIQIEYAEYLFGQFITNNKDVYVKILEKNIIEYKSYKKAKKLITELIAINLINKKANHKLLKLFFNKILKNIATKVFSHNINNWKFLSKIVFDKNFYSKYNLKHFYYYHFLKKNNIIS